MKKFSSLILAFVALVSFSACSSDDDVVFTAQPDPEGVNFTNTFSANYVLNSTARENTAERFVWNPIDVGTPTNVTYELQGSTSQDFVDFTPLGNTTETNIAVTVGQLMELAEEAGLDNDPTTDDMPNTGTLYFRVVASAGTAGDLAHTSEVQALTVMLPEAEEEEEELPLELFLVGDATPTGWDNSATSNNYPLFRDPANENIYYYTGKFMAANLKLIHNRGAWAPQFGGENGNLVARPTEDVEDPAPIAVPAEGYYTFTVNLEDLTYTLEPYDASGAATYDVIGLVGDGTTVGWPGDANPTPDIQLNQSEFDPHIWFVKDIELSDGPVKFRAELNWDVNWGGDTFPSGKATMNGSDIQASEGTYEVWFNDLTGRYIFVPQAE